MAIGLAMAGAISGATTATWELSSWRDFLAGRFQGVSLSRDGRLMLAPRLETVLDSDQPVIWSVVAARDGTLYAGTGHRGRVLRRPPKGAWSVLWAADQPEVFALALDARGVLYVGTSPEGKIFRIENGKAEEYFDPRARYIWALAFGPDGKLYAGTGDEGKIWRIEAAGRGEVYYETGQTHVTCLAFDHQGRLLAGTEPNGIVYRVSEKDRAFTLYDASLPEIRRLAVAPDGAVYVAAMGGSLTKRPLGVTPAGGAVTTTPVGTGSSATITVTEEAQRGVELKPKADQPKPAPPPTSLTSSPIIDVSGVEKAAIYRIAPDHTVETLWSSKEENIYDVLLAGDELVFGTDGQGRIYRLAAERKVTLVAQTNEGEVLRLLSLGPDLLVATGDAGKIYRLSSDSAVTGVYESPVHDAGTVARWGRVSWRGEAVDGGRVRLRTRTGNSARPDRTWSEWSAPLENGDLIPSPNARYIQWKAELSAKEGKSPVIDSVTVAYLPQNNAPLVRSLTVNAQMVSAAQTKASAAPAPAATYTITVTDTGESPPAPSTGTPAQTVGRAASEQLQLNWQAEDPDGDRLDFTLYFRGEDEREWKILKTKLAETNYTLDADALADGRYFFRVVASDAPSNPPSAARQAELVSAPVMIDRTPPLVRVGAPQRFGGRIEIELEAADAASALRRAEYSVDAGPWVPIEPADGVLDSAVEKFRLRLEGLGEGEHVVVVRVFDACNNAGLGKVVLR